MRIPKFGEIKGLCAEASRQAFEMPVYSAGISLYRFGVRVAGLGNHKASLLDRGQRDINEHLKVLKPNDRVIWVHCASLGEFEQGRPLIERLRKEDPEVKILVTFFSPSGYEVRKDYPLADCVCYLPFDTPLRVHRFLDRVRPEKAIFVKYEIWRNYLHELYRRQIPTYLISAAFRPDQKFFKRSFAWYGLWLKWFTKIFVQDEESRELLASINVNNVEVTGDTRFDRVARIRETAKAIPELETFSGRASGAERPLLMMAGSSWPKDEDVYIPWFNSHPDVKIVVAPHEFDEARLKKLVDRFDNGAVLLSEARRNPDAMQGKQALIIDCFGLLSSAYAYCDVAYVGGGFGVGIHNINEPAVYGVPVIYGPCHNRFVEAIEMAKVGCGLPITGRDDFDAMADRLFTDSGHRKKLGRWAEEYIQSKLGATDRIYSALFEKK